LCYLAVIVLKPSILNASIIPVRRLMDRENVMLNGILDTLEDGVYIISQDFTVEYMNRKMVDMFGKGVGKKCYQVINNSRAICPWCRVVRY